LEQVYDEVCALFPGAYIHIGGDECPKKRWKECPKCQARIKTLGLKDEDALQAWLTRHFTDYLAKKGRRAIGWDEVLAGDPGVDTVVHCWRAAKYSIAAAEKGHGVVVSSLASTYFSVPQGIKDDPFDYLSPKRRCSLATAYSFNPLDGMTDAAKTRFPGAECCM
jgi:hexosaminidase